MPPNIRQFDFARDYLPVKNLWEAIGKGVRLGRSDSPAELEKKLQRDPDLFLVAEAGAEIVGTVIGGFDGRRGMVYHLAVATAHRSRGIGGLLLEEVERRLKAKGCLRCHLMVTTDNLEAARFYEKRGWQRMDYLFPYGKDLE
jgi:ribosomal protein S18 acetylase RimI-like enzyme